MHWSNIGRVKRQIRDYDGHNRRPGEAAALRAISTAATAVECADGYQ